MSTVDEGLRAAAEIGYPVLVRPSFVLGGRAMQIVAKEEKLREYLSQAVMSEEKPVLVDKYIRGREVEVDAVCDGKDVFVPGIMELVERTRCSLRRFNKRISYIYSFEKGQRYDTSVYKKIGTRNRYRRTL